jgi:hypothetical protein
MMSHWAEVDNNNIVLRVLVGPNYGDEGQAFFEALGGRWVKTSYNAATNGFRKNYAGIGYTYDEGRDAFIAPKANCHDEEVLDEATCRWNCTNEEHTIKEIN